MENTLRRAARTDRNHQAVLEAVRGIGATVKATHQVGDGFPDAVFSYKGRMGMLEIKDGEAIPSKRKLTEDEIKFHASWQAPIGVVYSPEEAVKYVLEHS